MDRPCVTDDELQAYIERALDPPARVAVDGHCASCPNCRAVLAAAVRALFDEDAGAPTSPLDPGAEVVAAAGELPTVPFASYTVDEEIARGGLGRVLRARDRRLGRTVALKELLRKSPNAEERFVREALVTARLEHPAIIPVHEAGRWPNGEPFYAMKLVSGKTLMERIRQAGSLAGRLGLVPSVIAVAEAAAYAHSRGVIHRDLKPSNVLVGQFGETVVVDWGLAKDVNASEPRPERREVGADGTVAGAVMGTPPYMPPEQARGQRVDERADVYALGALLYEVLSGVAPYAGHRGDVLEAVIAGPPVPVEALQEGVPRDLLAIVRKAMARDPADRYPSARELAADLEHFQTGQLVSAREYSRWALVQRWLRRYRLPVAVAAAALAVVTVLGAVAVTRVYRARGLAEEARRQVEARNDELVLLQARAVVERDPTRALAWLKLIPAAAPLWTEGRAVAVDAVSRGFARHVWRAAGNNWSVLFSPDGRWLVTSGAGLVVRAVAGAVEPARRLGLGGAVVLETAFAADGTMVAVGDDGAIGLFPAASLGGAGGPPRLLRPGGGPSGRRTFVAITLDGRTVGSTSDDDSAVELLDVATGAVRRLAGGAQGARDIGFAPDGRTVATVSVDRVLRLHDLATGAARELAGSDVASRLIFVGGGARVLTAELSGIREWTLATGASRLLPLPKQRYVAVAASSDGATVAAAGFEGLVQLLDVASGQVATLVGHEALIACLDFSPDGRLLASASMDHTVRLWQLAGRRDRLLGQVAGTAAAPTFVPDGSAVAVGAGDGTIALLPLAGGAPRVLAGPAGQVLDLDVAPGGRALASRGADQTVRLWDLATGAGRAVATSAWVDFGRLVFSGDGRLLAASLDLATLAVFDAATGARVCSFGDNTFNLAHAFSPDGRAVAFTANEQVLLGDLASCARRTLYAHDPGKSAYALAFSADGRLLASASDDGTVGLHDLAAGTTRRLRGHDTDVTTLAFAPDGRTLASGSADRTLRLWDVATGTARVLRGHETPVAGVRFSPDGRVLASRGLDAIVRLWDVATGAGSVLRGHLAQVQGLAFSPDGRWLASGSQDGTVRLWPADPRQGIPVDPVELKAWLEIVTTARIDADDRASSP